MVNLRKMVVLPKYRTNAFWMYPISFQKRERCVTLREKLIKIVVRLLGRPTKKGNWLQDQHQKPPRLVNSELWLIQVCLRTQDLGFLRFLDFPDDSTWNNSILVMVFTLKFSQHVLVKQLSLLLVNRFDLICSATTPESRNLVGRQFSWCLHCFRVFSFSFFFVYIWEFW